MNAQFSMGAPGKEQLISPYECEGSRSIRFIAKHKHLRRKKKPTSKIKKTTGGKKIQCWIVTRIWAVCVLNFYDWLFHCVKFTS